VNKHVILSATKSLNGNQIKTDRTSEVAEELGAVVIEGDWKDEHIQRNLGVAMCQDADWIIVNDADMWYTKEFMDNLIRVLSTTDASAVVAPQHTYWYDIDHVLPDDNFMPVVAMRPSARFWKVGCVDCGCAIFSEKLHHLAWCKPKDILKKVKTYYHAPELKDVDDWYENIFCKWEEGKLAVMPNRNGNKQTTWVGESFRVVRQSLPQELRNYLQ
jgi:glycosyltransferase involved in cell wall biosynthesis